MSLLFIMEFDLGEISAGRPASSARSRFTIADTACEFHFDWSCRVEANLSAAVNHGLATIGLETPMKPRLVVVVLAPACLNAYPSHMRLDLVQNKAWRYKGEELLCANFSP